MPERICFTKRTLWEECIIIVLSKETMEVLTFQPSRLRKNENLNKEDVLDKKPFWNEYIMTHTKYTCQNDL